MKHFRPYIPLATRIKVAQRQLKAFGASALMLSRADGESQEIYLDRLLCGLTLYMGVLFEQLHLDHNPALCNRKFSERTGKYSPAANNPNFLMYRPKTEHDIKTRIRGDGAQLSDLALRRKNKRIAKRILTGKRPKYGVRT